VGLKSFLSRRSKNRKQAQAIHNASFIESLESRRLMAGGVAASVSGSLLTITGRPKNDNISLTESGSNIVVKAGTATVGTFATSSVKSIAIDAGKGNDIVTNSLTTSLPMTVTGGLGNDTITTGAGADFIHGNAGNDSVLGGAGNDTIIGDAGNDTESGGAGDDSILGGGNNDSLLGGDGNDTIDGSAGNDTITGDAGNDSLVGGDGVDNINGGNGLDTITGGAGNDVVNGAAGADVSFTEGTDSQSGVETTSPQWVQTELTDAGVSVAATTDQVTGKHVTITFTVSKVQPDSQVSIKFKNKSGNTYNFVVDVKKNAANTAAAVSRTIIFDLGNQDPGAKKIVVWSSTGQSNLSSTFTVTWIAPTG
jgi:Ca2+-binding RTX toxin-like protein